MYDIWQHIFEIIEKHRAAQVRDIKGNEWLPKWKWKKSREI